MAIKGYDDTPPRNGAIAFYTVLAIIILVAVKLTLDSYFFKVMEGEVHDKLLTRGLEPMKAMRARERAMQEGPNMSRAQELLSQRGRRAASVISPKSGMGEDGLGMEEVKGWTKLDRKVGPVPRPTTPAAPSSASDAPPIPVSAQGATSVGPAGTPSPKAEVPVISPKVPGAAP